MEPRLRVLPGPHDDWFDGDALAALERTRFTVTPQSNRVGYRLASPVTATRPRDGEMISDATVAGGIQVPPDGQPILLMADRQVTGGYPMLATVITADLPVAAQLAPGDCRDVRSLLPRRRAGRPAAGAIAMITVSPRERRVAGSADHAGRRRARALVRDGGDRRRMFGRATSGAANAVSRCGCSAAAATSWWPTPASTAWCCRWPSPAGTPRPAATSCSWTWARAIRGTRSWRAWWRTAGPAPSVCRAFRAPWAARRFRTSAPTGRRSPSIVDAVQVLDRESGDLVSLAGRRLWVRVSVQPLQGRRRRALTSSAASGSACGAASPR